MARYRSFTDEFKAQAVELAIEQRNVAKTARGLGIGEPALSKWVKLYKQQDSGSNKGYSPKEAMRLKQLEKENLTLRQENEFLKKAAAFNA
jgi:transposase